MHGFERVAPGRCRAARSSFALAGMYALGKEAKVSHSSLRLDVKNPDGSTTEWAIIGGSATSLARNGIGKTGPNALRPGDEITVTITPSLDGKRGRTHGPFPGRR